MPIVVALGLTAVATVVGRLLDAGTTPPALILLLAIVLSTLRGRQAGIVASLAGFAEFNFFFTPPEHSFIPETEDDVIALVVFVVVAAVVGSVVTRANELRVEAEQRETEVRRLSTEAREARVAAEVNRTRAGVLSAVSHNLRTPLAAIKASISTLLAPDAVLAPADARELLETVDAETDRLDRMVGKMLDLTRIRAGGIEPHTEPSDLAGLAQTASRRLRALTGDRSIRLTVDPDLPPVEVDPTMMEQVLLNLVENALRFAPPGSEIAIEAARTGAGVRLAVIDHGPGVPAGDRRRIFEEFQRGERAESAGTGLGLAIAKAYTELHGGSLVVEETPGGGATFVVRLPVVSAPAPETGTQR